MSQEETTSPQPEELIDPEDLVIQRAWLRFLAIAMHNGASADNLFMYKAAFYTGAGASIALMGDAQDHTEEVCNKIMNKAMEDIDQVNQETRTVLCMHGEHHRHHPEGEHPKIRIIVPSDGTQN